MNGSQARQVSGCKNGNCPKIYVSGSAALVQGKVDVSGQFEPAAGETVVEIPVDVLLEAAEEVRA